MLGMTNGKQHPLAQSCPVWSFPQQGGLKRINSGLGPGTYNPNQSDKAKAPEYTTRPAARCAESPQIRPPAELHAGLVHAWASRREPAPGPGAREVRPRPRNVHAQRLRQRHVPPPGQLGLWDRQTVKVTRRDRISP